MFKNIALLTVIVFFTSCGSYNSINSFYNTHKNDNQVTAIRVPQFMLSMLSQTSPEMQSLLKNTNDLRYMSFPSTTGKRTNFLNNEMNSITEASFIEIFRKNDNLKRNVISIREKRDVVKEILIYNNDNSTGSFLYFNGNFNPATVRNMAQNQELTSLSNGVIKQFSPKTIGITPQQD